MKGNSRHSGYEKVEHEWYVEPQVAVRALIKAERFFGNIWDPSCGGGTIPEEFRVFGFDVRGSDIADRGYGQTGINFLECRNEIADNIIMNPPFGLAEAFALHAIRIANHKVAVFIRLAWLEGEGRYSRLFSEYPPARVLVFRNRMSCPPGGKNIPAKGGSMAYCWVIWDRGHHGPTQLDWVRGE